MTLNQAIQELRLNLPNSARTAELLLCLAEAEKELDDAYWIIHRVVGYVGNAKHDGLGLAVKDWLTIYEHEHPNRI